MPLLSLLALHFDHSIFPLYQAWNLLECESLFCVYDHGSEEQKVAHHLAARTALLGLPPPEFLSRSQDTNKYWSLAELVLFAPMSALVKYAFLWSELFAIRYYRGLVLAIFLPLTALSMFTFSSLRFQAKRSSPSIFFLTAVRATHCLPCAT